MTTIRGAFESCSDDGIVTIKKIDGSTARVKKSKLSPADREYLEKMPAGGAPAEAGAAVQTQGGG